MECFYVQKREGEGERKPRSLMRDGKEKGEGRGQRCFAKRKKKLGQMPIIPSLPCPPILAIMRGVLLKITRDGFVNEVICHFL